MRSARPAMPTRCVGPPSIPPHRSSDPRYSNQEGAMTQTEHDDKDVTGGAEATRG